MATRSGGARVLGDTKLAEWTGPALGFAVSVFCFGILLARQGFFQDDWHHVFFAYWQGAAGLERFLLTDRGPFAWPIYAGFFKILGYSPAAWHWSLMLIRFLTVLAFWLSARRIWPQAGSLTAWLGLLLAVYPVFTLQPLAVAYTLHWLMFLVFMVSVLAMLESVRRGRAFILLTLIALLLEVAHLAMIEYFSGLELARPIFLWLVLRDLEGRQRIKRTVRLALPYLAILLLYAVYRSYFGVIFGFDRFSTLTTLASLLQSPLAGLQSVAQTALQDLVYVIFTQWNATMDPAVIQLARPSTYLILGSAIGFAALAYVLLTRAERLRKRADDLTRVVQVPIAGLCIVFLSMLPFWLTGFSIFQKNQLWSERLALAAMPGASMVVVGAVFALVDRSAYRHLILSTLLGLAVGLHVQTARSFQASWDKQRQLYWQLLWRAPSLQPNTMLVSDEEILFFMGIYPTAFALNLLYPQVTSPTQMSYWFNAGYEHINMDEFAAGKPETFEKYGMTFTATAKNTVAITFEPGLNQCLWVLRPQLASARGLTDPATVWLGLSDPSRIQKSPPSDPPVAIFGSEPEHTWCYYFERADLANQYRQWDETVQLWREVQSKDLRAPNGLELLPFIEAFAQEGNWQQAYVLTRQAQVLPDRSTALLCDLWGSLVSSTAPSAGRDSTLAETRESLGCTW